MTCLNEAQAGGWGTSALGRMLSGSRLSSGRVLLTQPVLRKHAALWISCSWQGAASVGGSQRSGGKGGRDKALPDKILQICRLRTAAEKHWAGSPVRLGT